MALHIKCIDVHRNDYTLHAILSLGRVPKGVGIRVKITRTSDRKGSREKAVGIGELNFAGEINGFKNEDPDHEFSEQERDVLEKAIREVIGPV